MHASSCEIENEMDLASDGPWNFPEVSLHKQHEDDKHYEDHSTTGQFGRMQHKGMNCCVYYARMVSGFNQNL